MKFLRFTLSRRISSSGSRLYCQRKGKEEGQTEQKVSCPSGPGVKSVCLYENAVEEEGCVPAEVDPEWKEVEALPPQGPRIVVVGAGPAGLTAAHKLIKAGVTNLTVLEAGCRAGGRLLSRWAGDTVVELGLSSSTKRVLSWDHPLIRICAPFISPPVGGDPTAGLLNPTPPLSGLFRAFNAIRMIEDEEKCGKGKKTPGYRGIRVEQLGRTLPASDWEEIAKIMAAIGALTGIKPKIIEDGFGAYVEAPGGTRIPLGETRMLIPLLKEIGNERVQYKKEVVGIRWGTVTTQQKPRAMVRCRDGSEFPADFVILTFSLGYLKRNHRGMFFPPLPQEKITAIQKAPFILENRAFMVFKDPIWSWSSKPIDFGKDEPAKAGSGTQHTPDERDWSKGIVEMRKEEGSERVVRVTVVGEDAARMERATDDNVVDLLHSILQEKLDIGKIPKPRKILRSGWCDGRHFFGMKAAPGGPGELATPLPHPDYLPPILLFAGEATAPRPGLEGAVLSGMREAERLIGILRELPTSTSREICPKICPKTA